MIKARQAEPSFLPELADTGVGGNPRQRGPGAQASRPATGMKLIAWRRAALGSSLGGSRTFLSLTDPAILEAGGHGCLSVGRSLRAETYSTVGA